MRKVLYVMGLLADSDIEWLSAAGRKQPYAPGSVLIQEGRSPDSLFILLDGQLEVRAAATSNRVLAVLGPGEIVGELSFVDSRPASATVSARGSALVLRIARSDVAAKLESDQGFAARFYRAIAVFLAQRLRASAERSASGGKLNLAEDIEEEDELDPEVLDRLALAAIRFDWMLTRLKRG